MAFFIQLLLSFSKRGDKVKKFLSLFHFIKPYWFITTLFGMYIIKAYHRIKEQIQRFKKINGNYTQQNKKTAQVIGSLNPLVMLIINLGIVSTLWIGLLKIDINQIQVGAVLAFINYLNLIFSTVTLSIMALMQLVRSLPSIQRLSFIFTLPKDISLIEPKNHPEIGTLLFKMLHFIINSK